MKQLLLVVAGVVCLATNANLQSDPAEAIRARIAQMNDRNGPSRDVLDTDAIFWSGAYARPLVGEARPDPKDILAPPNRRNQQNKTNVERIVISPDGAMAYEYSTFMITFDDDAGHQTLNGAALRVWRKVGNDWKLAANFQRPYGRVETTW